MCPCVSRSIKRWRINTLLWDFCFLRKEASKDWLRWLYGT